MTDSARPTEGQLSVKGYFEKGPDGRFYNEESRGPCASAEGLATEPQPEGYPKTKSTDCRLCLNWNPAVGCVLGYNQYMDDTSGVRSIWEVSNLQSQAWEAVGMFPRAIQRIENCLKLDPDDSRAYWRMARLYDHPLYQAEDKRRAMVLYQRFIELRRDEKASDERIPVAQTRIATLQRWKPAADAQDIEVLLRFTCFHRSTALTHFVYGVMTRDLMILTKIGDADPDTGKSSVDMGARLEKASMPLRWLSGQKDPRQEQELTRQELQLVQAMPLTELAYDSKSTLVTMADVMKVKADNDERREARVLYLNKKMFSHELIFPEDRRAYADQLEAVLRFAVAESHAAAAPAPSAKTAEAGGSASGKSHTKV